MESPIKAICRPCLPIVLFALMTAVTGGSWRSAAQSQPVEPRRRALLVGINIYTPSQTNAGPSSPKQSDSKKNLQTPSSRKFGDLLGPVHDVDAMQGILTGKYGFTDVKVLKNGQANRASIIQAILTHLTDEAAAGDICVFYYSGHGSRVRNSKDPKGWDESIVPSDSALGAPDIRDKELARLFLKAIDKGVLLTAIFDSCNSGSIARGYPQADQRVRAVGFDQRDVADAPDFKDTPEDKGMLVLSASKDEQRAEERSYGDTIHGDFTWALANVLRQPSVYVNESARRIFDSVVGIMKGRGLPEQPVLGGTPQRRTGPLFWRAPGNLVGAPTAAVIKVAGNVVTLKGGLAMGLNKDCELTDVLAQPGREPTRLRVTRVTGLDSCEAAIIESQQAGLTVQSGALFVLDRWVAPERLNLKVYIPPPITAVELAAIKRDVAALLKTPSVHLIDDPTKQTPSCVLQRSQGGWSLSRSDGRIEQPGQWPAAAVLTSRLSAEDTLFINVPPSADLRRKIALGKGAKRELIAVMNSPADAQYILVGRIAGDDLEYAWVRPGATDEGARKQNVVLPVRTDWFKLGETPQAIKDCGEQIEDRAVTLGKISGWLEIQPPSSESDFPYKLALRKVGAGVRIDADNGEEQTDCSSLPEAPEASQAIRDGQVTQGDCYDLVLVTDPKALEQIRTRNLGVRRQWIYVFSIDSEGKSALLFPIRGVVENQLPIKMTNPPPRITLNRANQRVWYKPPFGLDAYIMLASDEELTDPDVLTFDGVAGRGRGGDSALASLIDDLRMGTRSGTTARPTPLNWSIDRVYIRSVGKAQ